MSCSILGDGKNCCPSPRQSGTQNSFLSILFVPLRSLIILEDIHTVERAFYCVQPTMSSVNLIQTHLEQHLAKYVGHFWPNKVATHTEKKCITLYISVWGILCRKIRQDRGEERRRVLSYRVIKGTSLPTWDYKRIKLTLISVNSKQNWEKKHKYNWTESLIPYPLDGLF